MVRKFIFLIIAILLSCSVLGFRAAMVPAGFDRYSSERNNIPFLDADNIFTANNTFFNVTIVNQSIININDTFQINGTDINDIFWNSDGDTGLSGDYVGNYNINTSGGLFSLDWTNVSITESQISDLVHTTDTNASNCADGEYLDGNSNCLNLNDAINNFTSSTTYYPTSIFTLYGTEAENVSVSNISFIDDDSAIWDEDTGVNALEIYINFTGVNKTPDFIIMAHQYIGNHFIQLELWDYGDSEWELYDTIVEQGSIIKDQIAIIDGENHVSGELVQARFTHPSSGNMNHDFILDALYLVKGFSSVTTAEHDGLSGRNMLSNHPWAFPTNASKNITGQINGTSALLTGTLTSETVNVTGNLTAACINDMVWNYTISGNEVIVEETIGC